MSEADDTLLNTDENTETDNTESKDTPKVATKIEDIQPLTDEAFCYRVLNSLIHGEFGHTDEEITEIFAQKFGQNFSWEEVLANTDDKRLQQIAEEVLAEQLYDIQKNGVSMTDTNLNQAMSDVMDLVGLKVDISEISYSAGRAMFRRRAGDIASLNDTYTVLEYSRFLYDLYTQGSVSPEINTSVLEMQNLYRNGSINRDILAWYYYDVAMVYEKHSLQKNNSQAIYKEHTRSLEFIKKALAKTTSDIALLLNIRDALSVEQDPQVQDILDACHRVMDTVSDDESLYLAHKLYAETLMRDKTPNGFNSNQSNRDNKITEHYRTALQYASFANDKLDILQDLAKHLKKFNKNDYIQTQLEIAELLSGRPRIRCLKDLERQVSDLSLKKTLLKGAINEFTELEEIHHEDKLLYNSLDYKLRKLSQDEPQVIKSLDKLKKKYGITIPKDKETYFSQISSKGHDIFAKEKGR